MENMKNIKQQNQKELKQNQMKIRINKVDEETFNILKLKVYTQAYKHIYCYLDCFLTVRFQEQEINDVSLDDFLSADLSMDVIQQIYNLKAENYLPLEIVEIGKDELGEYILVNLKIPYEELKVNRLKFRDAYFYDFIKEWENENNKKIPNVCKLYRKDQNNELTIEFPLAVRKNIHIRQIITLDKTIKGRILNNEVVEGEAIRIEDNVFEIQF